MPIKTSHRFIFVRGVEFEASFRNKDSLGVVVPRSGRIIEFGFRSLLSQTPLFTINTTGPASPLGSTIAYTHPTNEEFAVFLTEEETAAITIDAGRWWTRIIDGIRTGKGPLEIQNL